MKNIKIYCVLLPTDVDKYQGNENNLEITTFLSDKLENKIMMLPLFLPLVSYVTTF
jgi:hypothetical protein